MSVPTWINSKSCTFKFYVLYSKVIYKTHIKYTHMHKHVPYTHTQHLWNDKLLTQHTTPTPLGTCGSMNPSLTLLPLLLMQREGKWELPQRADGEVSAYL